MSRTLRGLGMLVLAAGSGALHAGVVVERVEPGLAADVAGIRVGDVLSLWERTDGEHEGAVVHGAFGSALDVLSVELEQAPLGVVRILGRREAVRLSIEMPREQWGVRLRPELAKEVLASYRATVARAEGDGLDAAVSALRTLSQQNEIWFLQKAAKLLGEASRWEDASDSYSEAIELAKSTDPERVVVLRLIEGHLYAGKGRFEEAAQAYGEALETQRHISPDSLLCVEALYHLGVMAARSRDSATAEERFQQALELSERLAPESLPVAKSLSALGNAVREPDRSIEYAQRSLVLARQLSPDSLLVARIYTKLGVLASQRRDLALAEEYQLEELRIKEERIPDSIDLGRTLYNMGVTAWQRTDLATAQERFSRAHAVFERNAPGSAMEAGSLSGLGTVAYERGDLATAHDAHSRALELQQQLGVGGEQLASTLNNLGIVAERRGDLAEAGDYYVTSIEIYEREKLKNLNYAASLHNMGNVLTDRREALLAQDYYLRALTIKEQLAPGSMDVAFTLNSLGNAELDRGNLVAAEDYHRRSLTIREALGPDTLRVAYAVHNLGRVAAARNDLVAAEEHYLRALAIREQQAPDGLDVAKSLELLGDLRAEKGELQAALDLYGRSLAIREQLAPGSASEAYSLASIGRIYWRQEKPEPALTFFNRSIEALELQQGKLGGSEAGHSAFRSSHMSAYRDTIDLLVELHRDEDAFHLLERSRARGMLALLAERELIFHDVPADLEQKRRLLAADYDRVQKRLSDLSPQKDAAEVETLLTELRALRKRQTEARDELRQRSPRLAALQYPEPLDLAGTKRALDPGTALLSYSVGEERTQLFAVDPAGQLTVHTLTIGAAALRDRVRDLRESIEAARLDPARETVVRRRGTILYETLVAPAAGRLQGAKRVLIVPDGALQLLPFGALVNPGEGDDAQEQFLVEWKPLHFATSVTVYRELLKTRTRKVAPGDTVLLAFGAPSYPEREVGDTSAPTEVALRAFDASRRALSPLPATRDEVTAITALYGDAAKAYLGAAATEQQVKAIDSGPRMIHIAAHGLIDDRFPLDSAIAMTLPDQVLPGQENGLLQAWEVFEQMRIGADLVVLSACDTALGSEVDGEGLVGLTRAFQYAGARSVLASQWSVADRSTAELMKRFYGYMKAGQPKDEALRSAQLDLMRGDVENSGDASEQRGAAKLVKGEGRKTAPRYETPFHWAAFSLIGDWR